MQLSIVVPVYRTRACIAPLIKEIKQAIQQDIKYEIIFVDDGCPEDSWSTLKLITSEDSTIRAIKLSRNFGQHYAITAGIAKSTGENVIVMDCDLQDDPAFIPQFIDKINSGSDIVFSIREQRKFGLMKNLSAKFFYLTFGILGQKVENSESIGTFTAFTSKVRSEFLKIQDKHRHFLMILRMLGYKTEYLNIHHRIRTSGKSSYNLRKLIIHAIDGIISQSNRLLTLSIYAGLFFCITSALWGIFLITQFFRYNIPAGYTSLMVCMLFSSGLIMFTLGIHGLYLGKIFDQVRNRPLYIIDHEINFGA